VPHHASAAAREVQIDPAVRRRRQERLAHESAVRHDHAEIGAEGSDLLRGGGVEAVCLDNRQTELPGGLRDG
jgi:hypothetical protein